MEYSLISWLNRENNRLNEYADKLLTIKVNDYDLHNQLTYVDLKLKFDAITDAICEVHAIIAECLGNSSLLKVCVGFMNKISFMTCAFCSAVTEFQENMLWNN
jgi:hypothetical protein